MGARARIAGREYQREQRKDRQQRNRRENASAGCSGLAHWRWNPDGSGARSLQTRLASTIARTFPFTARTAACPRPAERCCRTGAELDFRRIDAVWRPTAGRHGKYAATNAAEQGTSMTSANTRSWLAAGTVACISVAALIATGRMPSHGTMHPGPALPSAPTVANTQTLLGRLPLTFERVDGDGHAGFLSRGPGSACR